jgi:hypothetical protein
MTTTKRMAANRRNAQKSTGPKTPEGKAVVRLNAMKHGLLSREVLLPDEDEATLVELGKRLRQPGPSGALAGRGQTHLPASGNSGAAPAQGTRTRDMA